ncbi:MAG TPA: c-type cytochrome [Kofleriaceae bacterium]
MKRSALLIALVGCTGSVEKPSETPPAPWGVPISGGTMLVTRDGARAVVADPDRDRVMIVELDSGRTTADLALVAGSDPGRIVEDGAGRVHIALRGTGSLLTLDATTGEQRALRSACVEPRGVAYDAATDLVHVACTSGELVSLPANDGPAVRSLTLDRDLRDVVVQGSQLVVSRFRTAELITLDAQGAIVSRVSPPIVQRASGFGGGPLDGSGSGSGSGEPLSASPTVAWRTIALPDGRIAMSHQRKASQILRLTPGGYESMCDHGIVESAITITDAAGTPVAVAPFVQGALPVDIAVDPQGTRLAFASAGRKTVHVVPMSATGQHDDDQCGDSDQSLVRTFDDQLGAPTSVAFRPSGDVVVFYPEYPALVIHSMDLASTTPRTITLPGDIGYDAGRALFHSQTEAGIACASCHPEARDDGQVWAFDPIGPRRTQSLAGGIMSRGPYHWSGDMPDLATLMNQVFSQRMFGGALTKSQLASLGPWLDRIPAPHTVTFAAADSVERGQQLFMSQELGCATCHSGPLYTNNAFVNVGAGVPAVVDANFKVPSLLGVAARPPYMHDGCAATLRDRFGTCGGGDLHGKTSNLTEAQLSDLIAFLESL